MTKPKLILLNFFCTILFICMAALCWKNLVRSTIVSDTDYTTFLKTLSSTSDFYKTYSFLKISHEKIIDAKRHVTGQKINLINMNTPLMSLLLHTQINPNESLEKNALRWTLLSLLFLIGSTLLLQIQIPAFRSPLLTIPIVTLFLLSWQSLIVFKMGQVTLFILPLLLLGYLSDQKKTYRNIGVIFLALAASLKLFFLLFLLLYCVRREWKLCIRFLLMFLFFSLIPLLFLDHSLYSQFLTSTSNFSNVFIRAQAVMNASLSSSIVFIFASLHFSEKYTLLISELLSVLCVIAFLFYDAICIRSLTKNQDDFRFAFITTLALILSPLAWEYYFLFLLLPVLILIKINQTTTFSKLFFALLTFSFILPTVGWVLPQLSFFHLTGLMSLILFLMVLHYALCFVRHSRIPLTQQTRFFLNAVLFNIFISCMIFHFNYGTSCFFNWNDADYFNHTPAIVWLP